MRIENLEYLLKVVECGSINKAAKALFCSQPALSSAIRALEDDLGFPLIARTAQGVVPTANGKRVVDEAKVLLNTVRGWKMMAYNSEETSCVDLAYRGLISHKHLMDIVSSLAREHPNINLRMHPEQSILAPTDTTGCRIGIVLRIPKHYPDMQAFAVRNDLQISLLHEDQFVLYLSTQHPLAKKEHIRLADLNACRLALPNDPEFFPYIEYFREAGCDYSLRLGDEENIMLAVSRNLAVSVRPNILASNNYYGHIMGGSICKRHIEDLPMPNSFYILTPPMSRLSAAEKIVVQTIKDCFSKRYLP